MKRDIIHTELDPKRRERLDRLVTEICETQAVVVRFAIDALYEKHFPDQTEIEEWNERYGLNEREPAAERGADAPESEH